jgi:hypothetical protein
MVDIEVLSMEKHSTEEHSARKKLVALSNIIKTGLN